MEIDELTIVELELKYCERCGALWLRPCGDEQVYCAPCTSKMLSSPIIRKAKGKWKMTDDLCRMDLDGRSVLVGEGGHA
jgi:hypothetical protein